MKGLDREAVLLRQAGYCWWCLRPLGAQFAVHHRRLRKHGGTDELDNLLGLHHGCHNLGTGSVHLAPRLAYDTGFLVHSWDDPAEVPVTVKGMGEVLLHRDGTTNQQREIHHGW